MLHDSKIDAVFCAAGHVLKRRFPPAVPL